MTSRERYKAEELYFSTIFRSKVSLSLILCICDKTAQKSKGRVSLNVIVNVCALKNYNSV